MASHTHVMGGRATHNFYATLKRSKAPINPNRDIHGIDVPFRMVIASGSGTGKTNALCALIHNFGKTWHEIIICAPSVDEPLYDMLDERLNTAKHKGVQFHENSDIPDIMTYAVKQANGRLKRKDDLQRLIVFDDYMMDKVANRKIAEYYLRGRKLGFSSVYISQNFYQVPRDVRINSQLFILGKNIQKRDIRNILSIFSIDLPLDKFTEVYNMLTSAPLDTIMLDVISKRLSRNIVDERYDFGTVKQCMNSYNTIVNKNDINGLPSDCE